MDSKLIFLSAFAFVCVNHRFSEEFRSVVIKEEYFMEVNSRVAVFALFDYHLVEKWASGVSIFYEADHKALKEDKYFRAKIARLNYLFRVVEFQNTSIRLKSTFLFKPLIEIKVSSTLRESSQISVTILLHLRTAIVKMIIENWLGKSIKNNLRSSLLTFTAIVNNTATQYSELQAKY